MLWTLFAHWVPSGRTGLDGSTIMSKNLKYIQLVDLAETFTELKFSELGYCFPLYDVPGIQ